MRVMTDGGMQDRLLPLVNLKLAAEYGRLATFDRMGSRSRLVSEGTETYYPSLPRSFDRKIGRGHSDKFLPVGLGNLTFLRRANGAFPCQHPSRNEFL